MKIKPRNPFVSTWWVSDVGYKLSDELLEPSDERFALYADAFAVSEITIEPPKYAQVDVCLWMVVNSDPSMGSHAEHLSIQYDPLEQPNLHRDFARIEITPEPIIEFANSFGFLGRLTEVLLNNEGPETLQFLGEALEDWATQIFQMRTLTRIWDLYSNPSPESTNELEAILDIEGQTIAINLKYIREYAEANTQASPFIDWDLDEFDTPIDQLPKDIDKVSRLRMGARLFLRNVVNSELREGSYASIDAKAGSPIYLVPRDLRGALYVLFAQEMIGQSSPSVRCAACGSYFIPEHGRQKYCDDRCKFKAYRQRQKEKSNV